MEPTWPTKQLYIEIAAHRLLATISIYHSTAFLSVAVQVLGENRDFRSRIQEVVVEHLNHFSCFACRKCIQGNNWIQMIDIQYIIHIFCDWPAQHSPQFQLLYATEPQAKHDCQLTHQLPDPVGWSTNLAIASRNLEILWAKNLCVSRNPGLFMIFAMSPPVLKGFHLNLRKPHGHMLILAHRGPFSTDSIERWTAVRWATVDVVEKPPPPILVF